MIDAAFEDLTQLGRFMELIADAGDVDDKYLRLRTSARRRRQGNARCSTTRSSPRSSASRRSSSSPSSPTPRAISKDGSHGTASLDVDRIDGSRGRRSIRDDQALRALLQQGFGRGPHESEHRCGSWSRRTSRAKVSTSRTARCSSTTTCTGTRSPHAAHRARRSPHEPRHRSRARQGGALGEEVPRSHPGPQLPAAGQTSRPCSRSTSGCRARSF